MKRLWIMSLVLLTVLIAGPALAQDFIVYPDRDLSWSYRTFNERVDHLAKGLLATGIGKGDHVGIWACNVPDWTTFMFATAKIGAVLVTINTQYRKFELEYLIKQADLTALVIIDSFRDHNYLDTIYELIPELRTCQRGQSHQADGRQHQARRLHCLGALMRAKARRQPAQVERRPQTGYGSEQQ